MTQMQNPLRILFVTPVTPFSSSSGSEQRSALMLAGLTTVGPVDVLQLRPGAADQVGVAAQAGHVNVVAEVAGSGISLTRYRPKGALTKNIEAALGRELSEYQLIVGRYVWPVCQLLVPGSVPVVVDLDDFHYRYARQSPWTLATARERLVKAVTHLLVRKQLKRFASAFVLSAQDQQEVKSASAVPTVLLPNVPFSAAGLITALPHHKQVLFVGSLWYRPNTDGVNWFLRNVWPKVLAGVPSATLTLVGAAPASTRAAWAAQPGVTSPGFVENLAATYRQASLVIVPILSGGGTNIKVLEALAHGRPCLMTAFVANAFAGYLSPQSEILVADSADDFAAQTLAALRQPDHLQCMATAGHLALRQHLTPELFKTRVEDLARQVLKCANKPAA